jgi:hypothetical protein
MPTYKLETVSTQFLYGSPEQIHNFVTDLPPYEAVTSIEQVDDLDLPQGVNPVSLGWLEILDNGGESPQAWADMARIQLTRLGKSLEVTAVSEDEAEAYCGNRYERFLWLGTSPTKILFSAVDLVACLNNLTPAQVASQSLWGFVIHLELEDAACLVTF